MELRRSLNLLLAASARVSFEFKSTSPISPARSTLLTPVLVRTSAIHFPLSSWAKCSWAEIFRLPTFVPKLILSTPGPSSLNRLMSEPVLTFPFCAPPINSRVASFFCLASSLSAHLSMRSANFFIAGSSPGEGGAPNCCCGSNDGLPRILLATFIASSTDAKLSSPAGLMAYSPTISSPN